MALDRRVMPGVDSASRAGEFYPSTATLAYGPAGCRVPARSTRKNIRKQPGKSFRNPQRAPAPHSCSSEQGVLVPQTRKR